MNRITNLLERHQQLKDEARPWWPLYQLIAEYVHTRKQFFQNFQTPGEFLTEQVFDGTAGFSLNLMASSLIGRLWPNGARSFAIEAPEELMDDRIDSEEIKEWYQFVTRRQVRAFDAPEAGFNTALQEYMMDQGSFGLSGIYMEEEDDDDVPFSFRAIDAKMAGIDENNRGMVDVVHLEREFTARQMVQEYGIKNVSSKVREALENGNHKQKFKVVQIIEPRTDANPFKFGNKNLPIASIHIEIDTKKILRESGYGEMPVFITRFWKAVNEKRGRSPAMAAIHDILELNAIREAVPVAIEKSLNPPLRVFDDGSLGGGTIDTSAGAINVFSVSGRMANAASAARSPIEPLITVGELQSSYARITELTQIIENHFFKDLLMDFNNETRMTLGEAHLRNGLREQALSGLDDRQIRELFVPMIQRAMNSMLRRNLLGYVRGTDEQLALEAEGIPHRIIPDAVAALMAQGKDFYNIKFMSPAARAKNAEQLLGIQRFAEGVGLLAGINPEALDLPDVDDMVVKLRELTGAPESNIKALKVVNDLRESRAQQQQAMMQAEQQRQGSEVARNMAQAQNMVASAQKDQEVA